MLLLAIDTATSATTVALHDGADVVATVESVDPVRHGEVLGPQIAGAFATAGRVPRELDEIVVGAGPGPFTGLRVGLVTARTLGLALGVPVTGVCTLDVLACAAGALAAPFLVATDARRKEVYWCRYADRTTRVDGPHVSRPHDIATDDPVVGRGAVLYPEAFPNAHGPEHPSAAVMATAYVRGELTHLQPNPLYLRRPDVSVPGSPKKVS